MKGVTILSVGGKHEIELQTAIARYETRLKSKLPIDWKFVPYSAESADTARRAESRCLLDKLSSDDYVVLLDETGVQPDSEGFSEMVYKALQRPSGKTVCIIGGAYGVDDSLHKRADQVLSLSKLVFPHRLVRLILVEQLYRAWAILQNHPYHHR